MDLKRAVTEWTLGEQSDMNESSEYGVSKVWPILNGPSEDEVGSLADSEWTFRGWSRQIRGMVNMMMK